MEHDVQGQDKMGTPGRRTWMVVIGRFRPTELATPTSEARNTLSLYLSLFTFGSPVRETPLWTIKERVIHHGKTPRQISTIPHYPLASL
jgi:hypothetical protein